MMTQLSIREAADWLDDLSSHISDRASARHLDTHGLRDVPENDPAALRTAHEQAHLADLTARRQDLADAEERAAGRLLTPEGRAIMTGREA